jgi:hypothetical protein
MPRLSHILDNRLTDGGEVVSLTRQPAALYPPGGFLILISVRGWIDHRAIVRLEGLGQLKNLMTLSGIEPATLTHKCCVGTSMIMFMPNFMCLALMVHLLSPTNKKRREFWHFLHFVVLCSMKKTLHRQMLFISLSSILTRSPHNLAYASGCHYDKIRTYDAGVTSI